MRVDLDKQDLYALVRGCDLSYAQFNNPLVIKGGHSYSDQYGKTTWSRLYELTMKELWELYQICKFS